jgi:hypothetical protein
MLYTDAKHWQDRAAETLRLAADTRDDRLRWRLIQMAVGYNRLAANLQERAENNRSD